LTFFQKSDNYASQLESGQPERAAGNATLFLLSICRDEDDAATLRTDLRRSTLQNYKLQQCDRLDDASRLLQVCGFEIAFLRIDDFRNPQNVVERLHELDAKMALVGLVSNQAISAGLKLPEALDAHLQIEDLSPSLVAAVVGSVMERRRILRETSHIKSQLQMAVESGELGRWGLDAQSGVVTLSETAATKLGLESAKQCKSVEDLLRHAHPEDRRRVEDQIASAIDHQTSLEARFKCRRPSGREATLELRASHQGAGAGQGAQLLGFIRIVQPSADEIRARIATAKNAIQDALALRDQAIDTAYQELQQILTETRPDQSKYTTPAIERSLTADRESAISKLTQAPSKEPSEKLAIDDRAAIKNVLKTLSHKENTPEPRPFPFDFSTAQRSSYSEPNPFREGFVAAAKRLASITRHGHSLSVSLSIDSKASLEADLEKGLLFEVLRELLTNVVKHAHASECIIALFRDEDEWVLQVEDDGIGLEKNLVSVSTPLNKLGLFHLRSKLSQKGGQLDLSPAYPKGLIARVRLPANKGERDAERA